MNSGPKKEAKINKGRVVEGETMVPAGAVPSSQMDFDSSLLKPALTLKTPVSVFLPDDQM